MEKESGEGKICVKHAVISITERTVKELMDIIDKAKKDGLTDTTVYAFSEFSLIDFKIDIGDNIESLGYKKREDK